MESRAVNFPKGASYGDVHVELNRAWEYVAPGVWRSISLGSDVDWNDVNNRPDLFPPSDHTHPIDGVTGLQAALDSEESARIAGDNALQTKITREESARIAGDNAIQGKLDNEIAARKEADTLLDLRIDAVEDSITDDGGFVDAPNDGKLYGRQSENWELVPDAGASDWADINNKPSTFPPSSHTHPWGEVTNKPTEFPPESHTHNYLSDAPSDGSQYARKDGSWSEVESSGVGGVFISDTEPSDPEDGMMWLDSTTAIVWVWDEDKWLEFPAGGSGDGDSLPEMTPDATSDTLVLRDGNANAKFNLITAKNFTMNQPTISNNTADTWFLSGGETSTHGVKKNDAAGMRASLDVYQKAEVDALGYNDTQVKADIATNASDIADNAAEIATKLDADKIWTGTEAEYNGLTPDADTLYFITA